MALFTDAAIVAIDDLLPFEASLAQVASSLGIDIDTKISLATSAIGDKLMLWLLNTGASDPQWLTRRIVGLSSVVVTPTLRRWMCLESLARIYAEAYNAQLNTRYQGKQQEYQQAATSASNLCFMSDLGIVYVPLPKPAMPLVSVQAGNLPAQTMFIQTTWVDANGNESALSIENATTVADNSSIAVAMAEGALGAPTAAVGWNVYGGDQSGSETKQNASPLSIGAAWSLPASGLQIGASPATGQLPEFYIRLSKQIRRG